jgi:hypothetical protein
VDIGQEIYTIGYNEADETTKAMRLLVDELEYRELMPFPNAKKLELR